MKKFLVVVDMQKDFVDGALGTAEAVAMTPRAAERIRDFVFREEICKDIEFIGQPRYRPVNRIRIQMPGKTTIILFFADIGAERIKPGYTKLFRNIPVHDQKKRTDGKRTDRCHCLTKITFRVSLETGDQYILCTDENTLRIAKHQIRSTAGIFRGFKERQFQCVGNHLSNGRFTGLFRECCHKPFFSTGTGYGTKDKDQYQRETLLHDLTTPFISSCDNVRT